MGGGNIYNSRNLLMKFEYARRFPWFTIYNSRNLLMKFEQEFLYTLQLIYNSRNLLMKFEFDFPTFDYSSTTVEIY